MPNLKEIAKKSAWLGALLVAAMYAVNMVFTWLKMTPTTLFLSVPTPVSPISSTIGAKIMNVLAGVIPFTFDVPAIIIMFISAFAVVLIGAYAISYGAPVILGKTRWAKVVWGILWGAAAFYLLIVGLKWISFNQALGILLYTIPASIIAVWIGDKLGITDKF